MAFFRKKKVNDISILQKNELATKSDVSDILFAMFHKLSLENISKQIANYSFPCLKEKYQSIHSNTQDSQKGQNIVSRHAKHVPFKN